MKYFWLIPALLLLIGLFGLVSFQKHKSPITVNDIEKILGNIDIFFETIRLSNDNQGIDKRLILVLNKTESSQNVYIHEVKDETSILDTLRNRRKVKVKFHRDRDLFIIAEIVLIDNGAYSINSAVLVLQ